MSEAFEKPHYAVTFTVPSEEKAEDVKGMLGQIETAFPFKATLVAQEHDPETHRQTMTLKVENKTVMSTKPPLNRVVNAVVGLLLDAGLDVNSADVKYAPVSGCHKGRGM